jgi:hypothetical protein
MLYPLSYEGLRPIVPTRAFSCVLGRPMGFLPVPSGAPAAVPALVGGRAEQIPGIFARDAGQFRTGPSRAVGCQRLAER